MTARRGACHHCRRRIAITPAGNVWTHGRPDCPGSRTPPRAPKVWPARHFGRRVITVAGPDTWSEAAR